MSIDLWIWMNGQMFKSTSYNLVSLKRFSFHWYLCNFSLYWKFWGGTTNIIAFFYWFLCVLALFSAVDKTLNDNDCCVLHTILLFVLFQVEAKKAEQQQPRGMGQGGNMGMAGGQMNAGYGRGQYGYPQQPGEVQCRGGHCFYNNVLVNSTVVLCTNMYT